MARQDVAPARRTACMFLGVMVLALGWVAGPERVAAAEPQPSVSRIQTIDQLRDRRQETARRRRVMLNNDGCDCLYFPQSLRPTVENFLSLRTTDLPGTHVTTLVYCSISSGFSNFTHRTKAGTVLTVNCNETGISPGRRNIAQDLIDQGTDCLQAVVDYGHRHGLEVFWSMRMNDTHDAVHVYRLVTRGQDLQVFVDDRLRIDAPGAYTADCPGRNELGFGSGDGDHEGAARWEVVRANVDEQVCQDLVLRVAFPKGKGR